MQMPTHRQILHPWQPFLTFSAIHLSMLIHLCIAKQHIYAYRFIYLDAALYSSRHKFKLLYILIFPPPNFD